MVTLSKQFISNLPTWRLFQMLGSQEVRIDVWMEMELENQKAGRDPLGPFHDEALIEDVARALDDRIGKA